MFMTAVRTGEISMKDATTKMSRWVYEYLTCHEMWSLGEPRSQGVLTEQMVQKTALELHGIMQQNMEKVPTNYSGDSMSLGSLAAMTCSAFNAFYEIPPQHAWTVQECLIMFKRCHLTDPYLQTCNLNDIGFQDYLDNRVAPILSDILRVLCIDGKATHADLIQWSVRVFLVDSVLDSNRTDCVREIIRNGNGRLWIESKLKTLELNRITDAEWMKLPISGGIEYASPDEHMSGVNNVSGEARREGGRGAWSNAAADLKDHSSGSQNLHARDRKELGGQDESDTRPAAEYSCKTVEQLRDWIKRTGAFCSAGPGHKVMEDSAGRIIGAQEDHWSNSLANITKNIWIFKELEPKIQKYCEEKGLDYRHVIDADDVRHLMNDGGCAGYIDKIAAVKSESPEGLETKCPEDPTQWWKVQLATELGQQCMRRVKDFGSCESSDMWTLFHSTAITQVAEVCESGLRAGVNQSAEDKDFENIKVYGSVIDHLKGNLLYSGAVPHKHWKQYLVQVVVMGKSHSTDAKTFRKTQVKIKQGNFWPRAVYLGFCHIADIAHNRGLLNTIVVPQYVFATWGLSPDEYETQGKVKWHGQTKDSQGEASFAELHEGQSRTVASTDQGIWDDDQRGTVQDSQAASATEEPKRDAEEEAEAARQELRGSLARTRGSTDKPMLDAYDSSGKYDSDRTMFTSEEEYSGFLMKCQLLENIEDMRTTDGVTALEYCIAKDRKRKREAFSTHVPSYSSSWSQGWESSNHRYDNWDKA